MQILRDGFRAALHFGISNTECRKYDRETEIKSRAALNAVKEGRAEDAVEFSMIMDSRMGLLSKKEMLNWHKIAAVSIALCTHAAIEGGLSPQKHAEWWEKYRPVIVVI